MSKQSPLQEMCEAIPASGRRGWREDPKCASHARETIEWDGETRFICNMHVVQWRRSSDHLELATLWGWEGSNNAPIGRVPLFEGTLNV